MSTNDLIEKIYKSVSTAVAKQFSALDHRLKIMEAIAPVKGEVGRDGKDGRDGRDGKDGQDALKAQDGKDGSDGKDGQNGENGNHGKDGKTGVDGDNGKDGIHGKDGENGKDAKDGVDGSNGTDGTDGLDGKDGLDGENGKSGIDGENGNHGKDGFGFDDLSVTYDGTRNFVFKFTKEDLTKEFPFRVPAILDMGVYNSEKEYEQGDAVSWGGSLWICQKATNEQPGKNDHWRLSVKKGRDGKGGKDGKDGERGLQGLRGKDLTQLGLDGSKW